MRTLGRVLITSTMAVILSVGPMEFTLLVQHIRRYYAFPDPLWVELIGVWGFYLIGIGVVWWLTGKKIVRE